MDCQHCGKHFSTKGNMINHQKSAKYCIKLREETLADVTCSGCNKQLCSKQRLETHISTCAKYIETNKVKILEAIIEDKTAVIKKLEDRIRQLELDMKDVAIKSKGRTTTNNITTNIQQNFTPITDERLAEDAKKLTIDHLVGGGESIAGIFLDGSLKNNALCTDVSRRILHIKDSNGNHVKDIGACFITKKAFSSIFDMARDIKNKCGETIDVSDDDKIEQLGRVMSVVGEISQAISGKTNEVSSDFAKAVCVRSTGNGD
jgi:hypothetical protein